MSRIETELIKALPELLPSVKILRMRRDKAKRRGGVDLVIEVLTPVGRKRTLLVDANETAAPSRVRESLVRLKALTPGVSASYPILASTFLSPRTRQICREERVGYLDLAGNSFLQFDDFYLERIVEKNPFPMRGRPASLFTLVSSRIVRALLEEPERTWHVHELAHATGVSLGQTSNVTRRLIQEAYLTRADRGLTVVQPAALLNAWQDQQPDFTDSQARYYSFERDPERLMARVADTGRAHRWAYAVTGLAAAGLIAPFVRGIGAVEWYVADELAVASWAKALDLRPAAEGPNVVVRTPADAGVFYRTQAVNGIELVNTVQLYLDLLREPGRGREQAEFLRKERIHF